MNPRDKIFKIISRVYIPQKTYLRKKRVVKKSVVRSKPGFFCASLNVFYLRFGPLHDQTDSQDGCPRSTVSMVNIGRSIEE